MNVKFTESVVEEAVLEWTDALGFGVINGPEIAPGEPATERESYNEVILAGRLRDALERLNPKIPSEALEDALRKVTRTDTPNLFENNRRFHRMIVDGVPVEFHAGGRIVHDNARLIDFAHPENNDWLVVNQFSVVEDPRSQTARGGRRPDVVLFLNGLPLVVIELKNAADEMVKEFES